MPESEKARGRPARHKDERLSKNRTFRVRDQLDQQLQEAAEQSGRSVSEEIEYRLSRSFSEDEVLVAPELQRLAKQIISEFWYGAYVAAEAQGRSDWTPKEWLEDQECYRDGLWKAVELLFNKMPAPSFDEKSFILRVLEKRVLRLDRLKMKEDDDHGKLE